MIMEKIIVLGAMKGRSRQVRLHLQSGIFIEKIRKGCLGGGF